MSCETVDIQRILAIETSCDDTSVAVVTKDGWVEAVVAANQDLLHRPFGGIVPEIASRNHTLQLLPLVEICLERAGCTWEDIDGLAVTHRPGLIGSLLVGLVTVKTLAMVYGKPFIGINHLEGHLLAPFLRDKDYSPPADFSYPFVALVVSGGHTHLYRAEGLGHYAVLGKTQDDAAGEAFDKFAKMIGLGFPGGARVDREAKSGRADAFDFPRPMIHEPHLDFSFSGLKAAAQRRVQGLTEEEVLQHRADWCASFQEAVVDVLVEKLKRAVKMTGDTKIAISGGVSANSRLRERTEKWAKDVGLTLALPPLRYCTDNAAMVGYAGIQRLRRGECSAPDLAPLAN